MPAKITAKPIDPSRRRLSTGAKYDLSPKAVAPKVVDAARKDEGELPSLKGTMATVIAGSAGKTTLAIRTVTDALRGRKKAFEDKDITTEGMDAPKMLAALAESGIAVTCRKGLKADSPNQDCYSIVIQEGQFKLFAVFDGHGPTGHDVSGFAAEILVKLFLRHPERDGKTQDAFRDAFVETQKMLEAMTKKGEMSANDSGSTGTVVYMPAGANCLFVAHVGDSRSVMGRRGDKANSVVNDDLTVDHKPELKQERERIEKAGGIVVFDGYFNYRVYSSDGRGGLNMSRALGDSLAHKAGVTAVPEFKQVSLDVTKVDTQGKELFVLLCSDGVWEFMESQAACDVVLKHGRSAPQKAVEELAKTSYELWMDDSEGEVSDDITAILVWL